MTLAEHSPADLVVQLWLLDSVFLERKHVENYLERVRSCESFQTETDRPPAFEMPTETQLADLTTELDDWFESRRRGRWSRVIVGGQGPTVWFLVRHGEPLKREESLVAGVASSICHQPIRYDVLVYSTMLGELQVNASSPAKKSFYRTAFGKHLFGDDNTFPGADKYTLDPLRQSGEAALVCTDVTGIDHVTLREVQLYFAGNPWELVTRKSNDFFRLLTSRESRFPDGGKLVRATFGVQFQGARKPRTVVIKPSNVAQFTRDEDAGIVERWLEARGFIKRRGADDAGRPDPVLASA